jgi:FAD/FMN-containing dehydrogenase
MESLNEIQICPDGQTALIGGGTLSKNITDTLWARGKQTVTGACECTSLVGPMLGGGHGWLQGRYGLSADQLVEARMVLANGDLVIVSNGSYADLFWALKGAGHNFGIVTQVKYKIHDVPDNGSWTYAAIIFTQDKLEQVFDVVNNLTDNGQGPVEYLDFVWYERIPEIDSRFPVVSVRMAY